MTRTLLLAVLSAASLTLEGAQWYAITPPFGDYEAGGSLRNIHGDGDAPTIRFDGPSVRLMVARYRHMADEPGFAGIPVDIDHALEACWSDDRVVGHVTDLRLADDGSLHGRIELKPTSPDVLSRYAARSPVLTVERAGTVFVPRCLMAVALTNHPRLAPLKGGPTSPTTKGGADM